MTNDVAGGITSFAVYYNGVTGTAAGDTIRCQNFTFGSITTTCSVYDPNNGMTYLNGAKTPNNLPLGSYLFTFYFSSAMTGNFNFAWASLSGTGDTGCISGTSNCAVPEPASMLLLGAGLTSVAVVNRRKRRN